MFGLFNQSTLAFPNLLQIIKEAWFTN